MFYSFQLNYKNLIQKTRTKMQQKIKLIALNSVYILIIENLIFLM